MKRNEACELLTKIAQSELIDMLVSKELIKARDICVCAPHKVLDVLATDEVRDVYSNQTQWYLKRLIETNMISVDLAKKAIATNRALVSTFEDGCDAMFIETRCMNCPNYRGKHD